MFPLLKLASAALLVASTHGDSTELKPDSLLKVLRRGGYTIVLRHARTDQTSLDEAAYSGTDRTTQRNLSGAGVGDSKAIGRVMKVAGIPFGEVIASPMFRTMETAQMAFGTPTADPLLRQQNETADQRALFTKAPAPGTNRAIVTHHFLIEHYVPGIKPGDVAESEGVVIRTSRTGAIELVGRFKLADWTKLPGGAATVVPFVPAHAIPAGAGGAAGTGTMRPPTGSPETVAPFDWQATAATRLAGLYLHTFNSGDEAAMRAFIEASLVPAADRPTEARLESYRAMLKDHGPITPIGTESASATEATIRAKSKRGEFNVIVTLSPTDPTRAASVRIVGVQ